METKKIVSGLFSKLALFISSLWLLSLFISSLWFVLGSLSAFQFQLRLSSSKQNSSDIAVLLEAIRDYQSLQQIRESQLKLIETGKVEKDKYLNFLKDSISPFSSYRTQQNPKRFNLSELNKSLLEEGVQSPSREIEEFIKIVDSIRQIQGRLKKWTESRFPLTFPDQDIQSYTIEMNKLKSIIKNIDSDREKIGNSLPGMASFDKINDTMKLLKYLDSEGTVHSGQEDYNKAWNEYQESYISFSNLQKEAEEKEKKFSDLKEFVTEVRYLSGFKFDYLVLMPGQLLSLMLALSMGAFGSVIYITREILAGNILKNPIYYFFRPFIGMISALAIFVLVKSGQMLVAHNGQGGETSPELLNPFFIAFISLFSGLFSEQAYLKLQDAGSAFLKQGILHKERWAFGLKKALVLKNKTLEELAIGTGINLNDLKNWEEETEPVPPLEQKIISAYLLTPRRNLFSIDPPHAKSAVIGDVHLKETV